MRKPIKSTLANILIFIWLFASSCSQAFHSFEPRFGYYYMSGVLAHKATGETYPFTEFEINGDSVVTDSLGRFWYKYYVYGSDTTLLHMPQKYILIKYRNQKIKIKSKVPKYDVSPKGKVPIRYLTVYTTEFPLAP